MIELINVNKTINNFDILKNINLTIKEGTKLGILGKSGAGKSSLLRTINGLLKPSSGEVIVNGNHINNISNEELNEIRKDMGMIFQHFNLLDQKNVFDNIALTLKLNNVPKDEHEKRVMKLLKLVGLTGKRKNYPKTLSGGEKQRVAIARALANNPKFLLCDEATSALDKSTSIEILNLLHKINKEYGVTIIFVSHDLDAIKYLCNEVVLMNEGLIIEENETLEMFTNPKNNLTKELINNKIFNISKESSLDVYQITYIEKLKDQALISNLIKKYNIEINILYGEVMEIDKKQVGFLYVNIEGEDKEKVLNNIKKEARVIKYV